MELGEFNGYRKTVETRGGPVGYVDVGDGAVAVFVHGVLMSSFLWHDVIGALAGAGRRCIALDLPAHGRTPARAGLRLTDHAEALEEFCVALGLEEFDLVANDTGGAVSQIFAVEHPERLRTLTLTNCDVHDQIPPEAFAPMVEAARHGLMAPALTAMYQNPDQARVTLAQVFEHPDRLSDEVVREYFGPFRELGGAREGERAVVALDSADLLAIEPRLAELTVPTLIAWGTSDEFFDVRWAYWLNDMIKGATGVTEIPGGKLFWPQERPAELVALLRQHWA